MKELDGFESVRYWMLSLAGRSKGTLRYYQRNLKYFCDFVGKSPDELIAQRKEDLKSEDPRIQHRMELQVKAFIADLAEKGLSPSTQRLAYSAVRSFFESHFLALKLRRSDAPSGEPIKERKIPLKDDIRKMCALATLRDRFLIKLAKDSGLRIGDIVELKYGDVKEDLEQGKEFINIGKRRG